MNTRDETYLRAALAAAHEAEKQGEIPIGAVVCWGNEIIATGHNRTIGDHDPCGHAEIIALRAAGQVIGNHRLTAASLFVTLEPCIMCAGAIVQARIQRLIFGAFDWRAGACGTCFDLVRDATLNHQVDEVKGGVLEEECRALLQQFFQARRRR